MAIPKKKPIYKSCHISNNQESSSVGIDLGTTYSVIATILNKKPKILTNLEGEELLPSIVSYQKNGIFVGKKAAHYLESDPTNTFISIKRLLGLSLNEIKINYPNLPYQIITNLKNEIINFNTIKGIVNPIQISAEILKALIIKAKNILHKEIDGAVITVPAYFNEKQRQYTKNAANIAGIKTLRLINEPTAAAVAYGLNIKKKNIIAIYDLGGGTFDISILKIENGIFEVLAIGGNTKLGGDDFDYLLIEWICNKLHINHDVRLNYSLQRKILNLAIKAKIELSNNNLTEINISDNKIILYKNTFNKLIEPLVKETLYNSLSVIKDAGVQKNTISKIILVGGSTKIPLIKNMVSNFFNLIPLASIDPDKVVAFGAAIQANTLIGNKQNKKILLLDIIPLSLGIETMGGLVEKIIPRNSKIPISKTQRFTTFKNNQTTIKFHIVQGEHDTVNKCQSLDYFILRNIPESPAGKIYIDVTFQIDADGLLSVNAIENSTGANASITIKPINFLQPL